MIRLKLLINMVVMFLKQKTILTKAGALNQNIEQILQKCNHNDLILVMDADGVVSHDF